MSEIVDYLILLNKPVINIATHNGRFHFDEIMSIYMVDLVVREHEKLADTKINIVRTRDPEIMQGSDMVIDVGWKYDGIKYFDHHQRGDSKVYGKAAVDLIWDDLKDEFISAILYKYAGDMVFQWIDNVELRARLASKIHQWIVKPISEVDLGIREYPVPLLSIQRVVMCMNDTISHQNNDELFHKAYNVVDANLDAIFGYLVSSAVESDTVKEEMDNQTGAICVVPKKGPVTTVYKSSPTSYLHFRLFMYPSEDNTGWYIHSFPTIADDDVPMCPAPKEYWGLNNAKLSMGRREYVLSFVHTKGFMGLVEGSLLEAKQVAQWWLRNSDVVLPTTTPLKCPIPDMPKVTDKEVLPKEVMPARILSTPTPVTNEEVTPPTPIDEVKDPKTQVLTDTSSELNVSTVEETDDPSMEEVMNTNVYYAPPRRGTMTQDRTSALSPSNVRRRSTIVREEIMQNAPGTNTPKVDRLQDLHVRPVVIHPYIDTGGFDNNPFRDLNVVTK